MSSPANSGPVRARKSSGLKHLKKRIWSSSSARSADTAAGRRTCAGVWARRAKQGGPLGGRDVVAGNDGAWRRALPGRRSPLPRAGPRALVRAPGQGGARVMWGSGEAEAGPGHGFLGPRGLGRVSSPGPLGRSPGPSGVWGAKPGPRVHGGEAPGWARGGSPGCRGLGASPRSRGLLGAEPLLEVGRAWEDRARRRRVKPAEPLLGPGLGFQPHPCVMARNHVPEGSAPRTPCSRPLWERQREVPPWPRTPPGGARGNPNGPHGSRWSAERVSLVQAMRVVRETVVAHGRVRGNQPIPQALAWLPD